MKITLTKSEIRALVLKHYSLPDNVVIEMGSSDLTAEQARLIEEISAMRYVTDEKITCIKKLRDNTPGLGLAEAKFIVENWAAWKSAVNSQERWPVLKQNSHGYTFE